MRKEASLELWKKLYERAKEIDDLAPWQYVSASNLISIVSENRKDPVFLNITGMGTDFRSVNLYQGLEGYGDYHMAATVGQTDLTDDYVMFEQNVLTLYWNSMMDVSPEQRDYRSAGCEISRSWQLDGICFSEEEILASSSG